MSPASSKKANHPACFDIFVADRVDSNMNPEESKTAQMSRKSETAESKVGRITVRDFACAMSDRVNNLLMGIWGNFTLLRLQAAQQDPRRHRIVRLEASMQNAGFLLHIVLEFFAERRAAGKQLRLNQLSREIKTLNYLGSTIDWSDLRLELERCPGKVSIETVAAILARVLNDVLQGIAWECRDLGGANQRLDYRLAKVKLLLNRGFQIIHRLRQIAEPPRTGNENHLPEMPLQAAATASVP